MQNNMHMKPYSVLLFILVWMQTVNCQTAQDCQLASFVSSDHYDSKFDTSGLKDSYPPGSQVRVPCEVGYVGFYKLVCLNTGWDMGTFRVVGGSKCELKPCGHPGDADYADFHLVTGEDFVFGSEVEYTCQTGYQMVSRSNQRRCKPSGWDGFLPVCEAKQCPAIHVGNDMQVTGEHLEATYGHVLQFRCKQNHFKMDGPKQIHCKETGEWSAQPPTCKVISCGRPDDVQFAGFNRTKGDDFVFGSEVQYTCQTGYQKVSGSSKRQCTLNGWDGADPVCQYCSSYLGIQYQQRPWLNDQLTASSEFTRWSYTYHSYYARLGNGDYWSPDTNNQHQWLQVDLKRPKTITGIITQGGISYSTSYYVKSFKVSHSDDGQSWTAIRDAKRSEIFTVDIVGISGSSHRENPFESPITSQFVRVVPWTWYNGIALRIELKGCDD